MSEPIMRLVDGLILQSTSAGVTEMRAAIEREVAALRERADRFQTEVDSLRKAALADIKRIADLEAERAALMEVLDRRDAEAAKAAEAWMAREGR